MNGNLTLGRLGGVEIRIHWSWVIVFALIVWTLAATVFPSQNPELSDGVHLAMAVAAALLFFASVLLHELGHAWQARRDGLEIDGITLWIFGGVAQFKGAFPSPGAEFRIAIAGPLVTVVLSGGFLLLALAGLPSAVDGVAAWLGYINLSLLVFNLIPALPLDGGRVLRAALWRARGDLGWATRVAAEVGRGFGYLFIALGVLMFVVEGSFSGAWLVFIGWFLLQAATAEARYVATDQALAGLRVRDLMARDPVTVDPDLTVGRFMDEIVQARRFTTYPVIDRNGRPIGLLPFSTVAAVARSDWDERRVGDSMIPLDQVPLLAESTRAVDALADLSSRPGANRGLVVDNGYLEGLLSITDLARALETRRPPRPAPSG
ncbi:MAG: site-2 protease family protein [Actinomycetota bacterium]|nr:site-2 protease family protein [Actinomycetota bacterium]